MAIETLFLDAGGVLVNPDWAQVSGVMAQHGVACSAAALAAAEPQIKHEMDTPAVVASTDDHTRGRLYFTRILERAGVTPSPGCAAAFDQLLRWHAQWNLWQSVPADAREALPRLRKLARRLVVVSNANGTLHAHLERLRLLGLFDCVIDSSVEGVEKPDPRIFEIALERSQSRRDATLHVGDLYHIDVAGARAAGIRPCLLDVAGLYTEADCPRVPSLMALADALEAGAL